jgi:DNA-directed RNA polymerase
MKLVPLCLLAALEAAAVTLPPYTREVLPNGVVLELMPRRGTPLVNVRVAVKGGGESDPAGMAGLAAVTAALLSRGTSRDSAGEFLERLDGMGARFSASVDAQASYVSMEFLSRFTGQAAGILGAALLDPAFAEDEVAKRVKHAADAARALKDSPGAAAWAYFGRFFFGAEHPYGRPHWGDEISLRRITREAVREYYRRFYVGANVIVAAAGDFDHDRMRALLVDVFGRLPAGEAYRWLADRPAAPAEEARLLLVDKPDATQTWVLIGFAGIRRGSPDLTAAWLVNTILGGSFTSMLNEALRVNGGLTYGAYSLMDLNRLTGAIAISTSTPTGTTERAVDKAIAVLDRLRAEGITGGQLQFVKNYLKGVYPVENLQTSEQLAALLADVELHGLDRREIDCLFERIDAVTVEEANAAVRKYFAPAEVRFVMVGAAARIRETVEKYAGEAVEVPIGAPGFGDVEASGGEGGE